MKRLMFFLLTTLAAGANTCFVATAHAQTPRPALTEKAATQLVEQWKAADSTHRHFSCLWAHREADDIVSIDSATIALDDHEIDVVGPLGCTLTQGVVRFVSEKPDEDRAFQAMAAVLDAHPHWILASAVYGILKGNWPDLAITEVPLAFTVLRKVKPGAT